MSVEKLSGCFAESNIQTRISKNFDLFYGEIVNEDKCNSKRIERTNKRPLSKLSLMLYYCEMSLQMHDEGNDNKSLNYAWHCSQNNPVEVYLIRYLWKKMHYSYPRHYSHQPYLLFSLCELSFVLNLCL